MAKDVYLSSKPRYEVLDGLRGVTALMVVIFHCFETYTHQFGTQIINHGYLGVDFFFALSGFVVGYAYDDRWDKMSYWGFFKRRLVRLHPMVIAGTVIGASLFFFGEYAGFRLISQCPLWKFALCFVMGLLMIPCGPKLDIRGWAEMNPFNSPNWTLTFEYIANILYAFVLRRLPKYVLAILCVCCAFFTLDLTMGWDVFGLFRRPKFDVIGGWSLTKSQVYIGFARLLYPFLMGLLISKILPSHRTEDNPSGSPLHVKGGFWWAALILVTIFSVPQICGHSCWQDGLFQAIAIIVVFPIVLLIGAGTRTTDPFSTKLCKKLGELSFPLYITHYPVMYMQMAWAGNHMDAPVWQHIMLNVGVVIFSIILAWGVYKMYDLPVREWLTNKFLRKAKA